MNIKQLVLSAVVAFGGLAALAPGIASATPRHAHKVCHWEEHHHQVCRWVR